MSVMLKTIFGTQSEVHVLHGLSHSVGREDLGLVVPAVSVKAGDDWLDAHFGQLEITLLGSGLTLT